MEFDAMVLGAGMVGVSVALHLQQRGWNVALVDRKAPGLETSFGNAGLIQCEAVYPYAFPRDWGQILHYATNRALDVRYHWSALSQEAPFLARYWYHSQPQRHAQIAQAWSGLIARSQAEHHALLQHLPDAPPVRDTGWLKLFRSAKKFDEEVRHAQRCQHEFGVAFEALDAAALRQREPALQAALAGAVHYTQAWSVDDPGALVQAYARLFVHRGGQVLHGDAATLQPGWRVGTEKGDVRARAAVLALGPWSDTLCRRLGYAVPMGHKRGYHRHYANATPTPLQRPVLDAERGYVLAPMARGVRLTTGAELGAVDTPQTPVQLQRVEPIARGLVALGDAVDAQPWMGARPCLPDMLPVIGAAPRHPGLWCAFGHGHQGFTLGPVTGRLLAEMMVGAPTVVAPEPFRLERF
jgi:D-amino-acid dehydrogenase